MKIETKIVHTGKAGKEFGGIVNIPPHRASTLLFETYEDFMQAETGVWEGPIYGRYGNRSTIALDEAICTMTGADHALHFSSGLAAIANAITSYCCTGDHLLLMDTAYGGTRRFCEEELPKQGVEVTFYDPSLGADIEPLIKPNTKMIICESPGSLTFEMQDIPAIAEVAHKHNVVVMADCTWAGPLYFDAFAKGVDIVMYSATKYMAGHSDLVMGVLCCKQEHHKTLLRTAHNYCASVSGDDCYLVLRGLKTMQIRMEKQMENALTIAKWLQGRPEVERVLNPMLEGDPSHELYKRDMTGGASLFGFLMKPCSEKALAAMFNGLTQFGMGYSWGGFESLMIPFKPSRTATGWKHEGPNVRIHVGLEHPDDLIADIEAGFERLKANG